MKTHDFSALIGAEFEDRGRGPWRFDCWGLVMGVRALAGKHTPDYEGSFRDQGAAASRLSEGKHLQLFIPISRPQIFDIVEFKPLDGYLHFGVMINDCAFLEIRDDGAGARMSRIDNDMNRRLIAGFWRDR